MPNNIKKIAKNNKIKITSLAAKTGIARSYIYDIINGKSIPSVATARKIANILQVSLDELFPNT